ncbi:MAG: TetR/AcrR family transcriptional regulator [Candidatus Methylomirabilales bacterium]
MNALPRSPRRPRWRRQPDERPQQILEAAFRAFGGRGLHGATLEAVAREAGISKGTIYLYFPDKATLFTAMMTARVNDIMPAESARRDPHGSTRQRLTLVGRRLYRFFNSPPFLALYRTIIGEAPQFPEAAATVYREGILPANRRLAAIFEEGIRRGEFRPVDPLIAARAFVGMLQVFAISQSLLGGQRILPLSAGRVVETVLDLLFHGLAAPASGAGRRTGGT